MSDYFAEPVRPRDPDEWAAAPVEPMPAWGGSPPAGPSSGPWPVERPAPWLRDLVGALGGLLVATGVLGILGRMAEGGDSAALLAGVIAAAIVAAVVVLLPRILVGPATAGAVSAAFVLAALPMAFWLSTADDLSFKSAASLALLAPTAAWSAAFLLGGTRGRPVFLAGALAGAWLLVCVLVVDTGSEFSAHAATAGSGQLTTGSGDVRPQVIDAPQDLDADGIPDEFDPDFQPGGSVQVNTYAEEVDEPTIADFLDPAGVVGGLFGFGGGSLGTALGLVSLLFGAGYLAVAYALDRRGLPASATPFQAVGIVASLSAATVLGSDAGEGGAGVLGVLLGSALLWLGTSSGRRLTSWLGLLLALAGVGAITSAALDDDLGEGVLLLVVGVGLVLLADRVLPRQPLDVDEVSFPPEAQH